MITVNDSLAESRLSMSLQLVESVLRHRGEISVSEIEAIPLIESAADVEAILDNLTRRSNVEISQRKVSSTPFLRWDRIVRVK